MVKVLAASVIAITLVGCGSSPVKLRTETIEVVRPVLYCPAPNYEELARPPALPIDSINANSSPGEIAVRYKATVKMLQSYIERLELTLDQYNNANSALEGLKQELEASQTEE